MKRKLFIILMLIIWMISTSLLVKDLWQSNQDEKAFKELRKQVETKNSTDIKNDEKNEENNQRNNHQMIERKRDEEPINRRLESSPQVLEQYKKLVEINNEFVGWLEIENTKINYPVMQTADDEEYYLYRNFERDYSPSGTPFLSAHSRAEGMNNQIIVYGHNMNNGTVFSDLLRYKEKEFWEETPQIGFDTLYKERSFEIFAVFEIDVTVGNGHFEFYNYPEFQNNEEFMMFIKEVEALALYDTKVDVRFGETILTLVTCENDALSKRMVVMGVEKKE